MRTLVTVALFAGACLGQRPLRPYLALDDAQAAAIMKLNSDYQMYWYPQVDRTNAIGRELTPLLADPKPDIQAIGSRALELETIRRDEVAKQGILQAQVRSQLTPAQLGLLQNLSAAATLQPLVNDAGCAYLLPPVLSQWFDTTHFVLSTRPTFYPSSTLPYIPPAPTGSFCGSQVFPISVREYLSLSDAQVAVLYTASAAYADFYLRQQNRLADLNQQIAASKSAGATDPAAVGAPYAEMARIGHALDDKNAQLRDQAKTQLTPSQLAKLQVLQDASTLQSTGVIDQAISCNLLLLPAGSSTSNTTLTGVVNSCFL